MSPSEGDIQGVATLDRRQLVEVLWRLGDVLEREWLSRRLDRRLEMPHHHSRRNLCHRTHTVALFRHRRHLRLRQRSG
ncbi:hypothetical protein Taro_032670 [Colocasia esculenta]|uniref:Uncharacterized protein n=1 Tax=Colocasia esculenta TaxID=4460 RepID=A0A843VZP2_COLES|nr:hypothetical protein [Colocasia esculenta]